MNKFRHTPNIHEYLDKSGVLVNGSEDEIKAVKKEYRKKYLLEYKRWQRKNKPEYTVHFSGEREEYGRLKKAATEHKMKISGFIKSAVFAYLSKTYLTPNREEIVRLELILGQIATGIRSLCSRKTLWANTEERFGKIEELISKMENTVSETLRNPQTLEECLEKIADGSLKQKLLAVISHNQNNHDNKNKNAQETGLQTTA